MWTGAPLPDAITGPVGLAEVLSEGVGATTVELAEVGADVVTELDTARAATVVRVVQPASNAPVVAKITRATAVGNRRRCAPWCTCMPRLPAVPNFCADLLPTPS